MLKPLHQGISVPDMDASIRWYTDVFGFRPVSDAFVPRLNARIVFLDLNGFEIELFQYMGDDKKPLPPERLTPNEDLKTCGTKHVAYAVADMPAMLSRLTEKQVDVVMSPFPMNGDLVCFIRDNAGTLIELIAQGAASSQ